MGIAKRILIADDHAIVRAGLRIIIDETVDLEVAGEAASGSDVLRMVASREFDLVLLDIQMPDRNGLDVLRDVKAMRPRLPAIMLSMHPEERYALRCLRAGAHGYLTKDSPPAEVVTAIRRVLQGKRYVTPTWQRFWPTATARMETGRCMRPFLTESSRSCR